MLTSLPATCAGPFNVLTFPVCFEQAEIESMLLSDEYSEVAIGLVPRDQALGLCAAPTELGSSERSGVAVSSRRPYGWGGMRAVPRLPHDAS